MKIPDGTVIYFGKEKITGEISDEKARAIGLDVPVRKKYVSKTKAETGTEAEEPEGDK